MFLLKVGLLLFQHLFTLSVAHVIKQVRNKVQSLSSPHTAMIMDRTLMHLKSSSMVKTESCKAFCLPKVTYLNFVH